MSRGAPRRAGVPLRLYHHAFVFLDVAIIPERGATVPRAPSRQLLANSAVLNRYLGVTKV